MRTHAERCRVLKVALAWAGAVAICIMAAQCGGCSELRMDERWATQPPISRDPDQGVVATNATEGAQR